MKLCRFNENRLGLVQEDQVLDVTESLDDLPALSYPYPLEDQLVANLVAVRSRVEALKASATSVHLASVSLLSPVPNPGKIIAAPVNYVKHLQEVLKDRNLHHDNQINHIEKAGLFFKARSSMVGASKGVTLGLPGRRTDHEIELVIVIGKAGKDIAVSDGLAVKSPIAARPSCWIACPCPCARQN